MLTRVLTAITEATREQCAAILSAVSARLLTLELTTAASPVVPSNDCIDAGDVATMMRLSAFTVRRLAKRDPLRRCRIETGTRRLLFSRARVEETLRHQAEATSAGTGGHAS